MRTSSRVNREQQVKVVIRLRPQFGQTRYLKSVYLSPQDENQLVVQTDSKKEIFMFDHIAHELTNQQEIYHMMGQECVQQTFQGYNCCIFAYGQTGAGKTFSVLGNQNDLQNDPYCPSRGILPRVLEDTIQMVLSRQEEKKTSITCSYIEIYNEQIFDLLSTDKRIHQIREDAKKGVFVEGLIQKKINSYKNGINLLIEGEKTRRMASTLMNTESSRSHTIFTILVETQTTEDDMIKSKKAKLHIVDLAGSERVKHTNVEGERLRQGCNINKSLHVLCNVINSLAQASKRKKHIPFRDSKLTHFLKDSLGGNSITKLLANIHTGRQYFGDTLSTLMFAKRAKSLRLKVEQNETVAQNFDGLRKQVRRLRQQLAQARYFKLEGRLSDNSTSEAEPETPYMERALTEQTDVDISGKSEVLKALQENELHYKLLIQIYEEHMKTCLSSSNFQRRQNINIVKEWKNLEKRNISLTHLVKQMPSFAKIYKENILLRQERNAKNESILIKQESLKASSIVSGDPDRKDFGGNRQAIEKIVEFYEGMISEVQEKFKETLESLEKSFQQLENECKIKDKKIKDLKQRWEYPPDLEQLKNENEYLQLNILNLQDQIKRLQAHEQKMKIEFKESKRSTAKKASSRQNLEDDQDEINLVFEKLQQIKHEAQKQSAQNDLERAEMQMMIHKLQAEINKYMAQNSRLRNKYSKSKSKRRSQSKRLEQVQSMSHSNAKNKAMNTPEQKEMFKSEIKYLTNSAVSMISGNEDITTQQQNYTKELLILKMDIKRKQKQIADLRKELDQYINGDRRIEDQFGKSLDQIIEEYRQTVARKTLQQSKSVKVIQPFYEQKTFPKDNYKKDSMKRGNNLK